MNTRTAFNNSVDFLLARPGYQIRLVCIGVAALLVWRFIATHDSALREDGAQSIRDSVAATTAVRLHRQKDSIGHRIDTQTVTLTRTTHRLDTLWRTVPETLRTHEDTAAALDALPILRRSTDSAVTACSELVLSCASYRLIADSTITVLTAENTRLRARVKPPSHSTARTVLQWAELGAAAYVGFRLGRSR